MDQRIAWVTGAGGEIGHMLVPELLQRGYRVLAMDLKPLGAIQKLGAETAIGDILDESLLDRLFESHPPNAIFHLAAVLSGKSEQKPYFAHRVNVDGTCNLFEKTDACAVRQDTDIQFFFPSSIASYGLPDLAAKRAAGAVTEDEWDSPTRAYGCHKRYGEMFGTYLSRRAVSNGVKGIDFRVLRYPGLISADTLPSGGSSDFAPEMIHAAVHGNPYTCWVTEETRIPFMTMPDAVEATLQLMDTRRESLTRTIYNLRGFAPSAGELAAALTARFPSFQVTWQSDPEKQTTVDGWPEDVEDLRARADWGLSPRHDLELALDEYLIPALI